MDDADLALDKLPESTRTEFIAGRIHAVAATVLVPEVKRQVELAQTVKEYRARAKALISSAAKRLPEDQQKRFFDEQVAKDPILDELFKRF